MCSAPWYEASSPPRSASAAGASESTLVSNLADGGRSDESAQPLQHDSRAEHRAEHARPLERQLRLGQRALHLGQQRERLGEPRRPAQQRVMSPARRAGPCGARPPSARRRRSGSRTPRRSVRARARRCRAPCRRDERSPLTAAERSRSAACSRAAAGPGNCRRRPAARRPDDGHHLADRRGREGLVGGEKLVERERRPPHVALQVEHERPRDAGQHARAAAGVDRDARRCATRCSRSRTRGRCSPVTRTARRRHRPRGGPRTPRRSSST